MSPSISGHHLQDIGHRVDVARDIEELCTEFLDRLDNGEGGGTVSGMAEDIAKVMAKAVAQIKKLSEDDLRGLLARRGVAQVCLPSGPTRRPCDRVAAAASRQRSTPRGAPARRVQGAGSAQEADIQTALVRRGPWGFILDRPEIAQRCRFQVDSLARLPELVRRHNASS